MTLIKTLYLIEEYLFSLGYFAPYKTYPDDGYRFYYHKINNTDSAEVFYAEFDYDNEDDDESKIIVTSSVMTSEGLVISKYKETLELFDFEKMKTIITE